MWFWIACAEKEFDVIPWLRSYLLKLLSAAQSRSHLWQKFWGTPVICSSVAGKTNSVFFNLKWCSLGSWWSTNYPAFKSSHFSAKIVQKWSPLEWNAATGTDEWKMETLDRQPGPFFGGINPAVASEGRSQWLFTAGPIYPGCFRVAWARSMCYF